MIEKKSGETLINEAKALFERYGIKMFAGQLVDSEGDVLALRIKHSGGTLTKVGKVATSPLIVRP